MTYREMLENYRETLLQLDELESQLAHTGTDGRPAGCRTRAMDAIGHGTNNPTAAALQLAEGLEALSSRKREDLSRMSMPLCELLSQITDHRTYMVIQRYYLMAETDASIAAAMSITRERVNQIRRRFLRSL